MTTRFKAGGGRAGAAAAEATMTMSRPASAAESLERRCQDLVTVEMARLSRRVPGLQAEHLGEVEVALSRVTERLAVSRARTAGADELAALFALGDAP